jgi:four helix bundle protein
MSKIEMFEDTELWKKGRVIVNKIYDFSSAGEFAKDFAMKNQMRDAGLSIVSNITEGFERDGDKENLQFISYAKGSAGEARAQLYIAFDRNYISRQEFEETRAMLPEESRMCSGFMRYLRSSRLQGRKRKEA